MINLQDITKSYLMGKQELQVLRGISLHIEKGEFVAIMGPSGSGKSTLMNVLGCLDVPTSGSYHLNGQDVSRLKDDQQARIRNKEVGFVFQRFNLLARTSAVKQVALPLMYAGMGSKERLARAENFLGQVGLGERIHHKPEELSGGQQQRVAIARALATDPSLILADEPTGALDSATGAELLKIFEQLHEQGKTIVVVTHDPNVARHTKRVIRVQDGVIIGDDPVIGGHYESE